MKTEMSEQELRELNRFIWLKVFGWIDFREEQYPYRHGYALGDKHGEKCLECDMPECATDPAAAMQVLAKCAEKCGEIMVAFNGSYSVHGSRNGAERVTYGPTASTLPLAIALFSKEVFGK